MISIYKGMGSVNTKQQRNCWVSEDAARSYRKIFEKVKFWLIISKKLLTVLYISCGQVSEVISLGIQLARVDNPQDDLGIILHLWSGTDKVVKTPIKAF